MPFSQQATSADWRARESTTSRLGSWGSGGFGGDAINEQMSIPGGWDNATLDDSSWDAAEVVVVLENITVSVRGRRRSTNSERSRSPGPWMAFSVVFFLFFCFCNLFVDQLLL